MFKKGLNSSKRAQDNLFQMSELDGLLIECKECIRCIVNVLWLTFG
jgi:hypothetical protein